MTTHPGKSNPPSAGLPTEAPGAKVLHARIVEAIKTVYDPEIPVNIYDLGLIYDIDVDASGDVRIEMTLTSPMCPVAETMPPEVQRRVAKVEGIGKVDVEVVWEPPWTPDRLSEEARLQLNL